jgi:hypothetical protein
LTRDFGGPVLVSALAAGLADRIPPIFRDSFIAG